MFAAHPGPRTNPPSRPIHRRRQERAAAGTLVPYDFGATFKITGRPGNLLQDVINVSSDGVFVAVGIGYGFEEDRERNIGGLASNNQPLAVGDLKLGQLPLASLIEGFRVNPKFAQWISDVLPVDRVFGSVLQKIKAPEEISFLFSLVDSGTGREFQDQAAHNLASLGKSNGERPFRLLAQPFYFAPRSTLRLQITERTEGVRGTLFVVLYGYRVLGASSCPEPVVRQLRGSPLCPVETIGNPDAPSIPFDYVSSIELTGRRGNLIEDELAISVDGGFVATTIGYGLAVEERDVKIQLAKPASGKVPLGGLSLSAIPPSALLDGIRIRPGLLRIALENNGLLAGQLPFELLDSVFERLNRSEDVSFRYAFFDTGTGRELQNQRLNNIAGLGIADGDRPFKKLARPMVFLPRSTIRVEIEELFGRGTLFIAFQGYKLLERQRAPT